MKFAQNLLQAAVTTWLPLHSSTNQRSLAAKNATLSTDTQCALLRFQLLATSLRSLVLILVRVLVHVLFLVLVLLPFLLQRILMSKSHFEIFTQLNTSVTILDPNHHYTNTTINITIFNTINIITTTTKTPILSYGESLPYPVRNIGTIVNNTIK